MKQITFKRILSFRNGHLLAGTRKLQRMIADTQKIVRLEINSVVEVVFDGENKYVPRVKESCDEHVTEGVFIYSDTSFCIGYAVSHHVSARLFAFVHNNGNVIDGCLHIINNSTIEMFFDNICSESELKEIIEKYCEEWASVRQHEIDSIHYN